jgi:hypothetical protein
VVRFHREDYIADIGSGDNTIGYRQGLYTNNNGLDMVCYDYCACCFLCLSQSKIAKIM